ncbi:hypothetical protein P8C59_006447 [Phyllachora maydis]|uniref:Uncharacterized protein n=1 Tax=Phyllachora maydis TaxID=1825666 RepID=A0AAD9I7I5_9PEZI|nr:hypothetical protein P8C59_006447 [Phyllachora maydis]
MNSEPEQQHTTRFARKNGWRIDLSTHPPEALTSKNGASFCIAVVTNEHVEPVALLSRLGFHVPVRSSW